MRFKFRVRHRYDPRWNSNFSLDMKTAEAFRIADKIITMNFHLDCIDDSPDSPDRMTICFDGKDCHDFTEADFDRITGFLRESRPEVLPGIVTRIYERNGLDLLRRLLPGFYIYDVHSWTDKNPHNNFDDERVRLMAKTSPWVTGHIAADHALEGKDLYFTENFVRYGVKYTHCDWYSLAAAT